MSQFNLFDEIILTEKISLTEGSVAPIGTIGAIVEILKDGEAYIVELFGNWVKYNDRGDFIPAKPEDNDAFIETIGVEIVYPHQLHLSVRAKEMSVF